MARVWCRRAKTEQSACGNRGHSRLSNPRNAPARAATLEVQRMTTAAATHPGPAIKMSTPPSALATSPDGRFVAAGMSNGAITLLDARSGATLATLSAHARAVRGLAFSDTSRLLASAGADGAVHLWDAVDARLLMTPAERDVAAIAVAMRPDGRVGVAWDDGRVDVVDVRYFDRHVRGNEPYQRLRLPR